MEREENKLFKYATKELSQDAFICWCINWINYPDSNLYQLGKDFLDMIVTDEKGNKKYEITKDTKVKIVRQYERIDILVVIDNKYLVIIEDKVNSFNHGQITSNIGEKDKVYKYKLINLLSEDKCVDETGGYYTDKTKDIKEITKRREELEIKEFDINNIFEVYVKTGIMCALDNAVHAIKVDAKKILNILEKYINESEIVRDYYECIKEKIDLIDETIVDEIIEDNSIKIGTKFRYRAMCYNCFFNITKEKYSNSFENHMNIRLSGNSVKLNNEMSIWTPRLFSFNGWRNTLIDNENTIVEEKIEQSDNSKMEQGETRFVFARRLDIFNDEYFEFIGVYKLDLETSTKHKRYWKRLDLGKEIKIDLEEIEKV